MDMTGKAFLKKLFGRRYERFPRSISLYGIVFWGLHLAAFRIRIAPFILYLMTTTFTAGVMWQALSSRDHAAYMENLIMLPFERKKFIFSYVAALGSYTFFTRTAGLLAVLLAVSLCEVREALGSVLCAANAILMAAAVFSLRKYQAMAGLWMAAVLGGIVGLWDKAWFMLLPVANSVLALFLLQRSDGYCFYLQEKKHKGTEKEYRHGSVWRYLFRYLRTHKNYLANTAILWCVAGVLPLFFRQTESLFAAPLGFAILSLNTPLGILLSCDPALEQAVRFLPDQKKLFCIPYGAFLFLCNLIADSIYLCSLEMQTGGLTLRLAVTAVFFALGSAVGAVLLEWFCPLRGWKIESDLWHHPRKYVVPGGMLLLAGFLSFW